MTETVLDVAMRRVDKRLAAVLDEGVEEGTIEGRDAVLRMFSGLPVPGDELHVAFVSRTKDAVASLFEGVPIGSVLRGVMFEALLLGYYMAKGESG